jgi:hypothetical protein
VAKKRQVKVKEEHFLSDGAFAEPSRMAVEYPLAFLSYLKFRTITKNDRKFLYLPSSKPQHLWV